MENSIPNQPALSQPPRTSSGSTLKNILLGLFVGVLVGIAGLLFYQGHLSQITNLLYLVSWAVFGFLVATFLLLFGFRAYVTRFVFGNKTAQAGDVLEDAQRVSDVLIHRVLDGLLKDTPEVKERVQSIAPRLANWFVWSRLRNWWWQWMVGIFVSLGGITGTMLLMNQNKLLEAQNGMIQLQMSLEEANRRSALVVLMSNIMDKVDREIERQQVGLSEKELESKRYKLSQSLIGQIAALSHSFKPYRYMDGDTLIAEPLSPERGQLLVTLTLLPLDTATFSAIYKASTFYLAGLRRTVLRRANLRGVDLKWADLTEADLTEADLTEANLRWADLTGAFMKQADLTKVNLSNANLRQADLSEADLNSAYLSGARLGGTNLSGADLSDADLSLVNLIEVNWEKANLKGAMLDLADWRDADEGEIVDGVWWNAVNLTIQQASEVKSLWRGRYIPDSIRIPLQQSHPQLFEKPKE